MYRPSFSRSFPLLYGGREKAFLKRAFFSAPNDFSISAERFFNLRQTIFKSKANDFPSRFPPHATLRFPQKPSSKKQDKSSTSTLFHHTDGTVCIVVEPVHTNGTQPWVSG